MKAKIMVIDDEAGVRFGVRDYLEAHGFEVSEAADCAQAEEVFSASIPDFAIVDYRLPDGDALKLIPRLKKIGPDVPMIILTAHGSIELAVEAIKHGADHFLTKPVELSALLAIATRMLENQRNRRQQRARKAIGSRDAINPFLGDSPVIMALAAQAAKVANSDIPVLIQGETGTGKGVLASWLHANGPRAQEAFVDLSCAGLTRQFLETELFGHVKGAFTGAASDKEGLFDVADRGTVFLDEIGDMDAQIQPRLLKVLEEKKFRRLGAVQDRQVDIRLIAATHKDLRELVGQDMFRNDLFFRISAVPLEVPALRDRQPDLPILIDHLLQRTSTELGAGREIQLSSDALRACAEYTWPGNIRELRNVLERAVLLTDKATLEPEDLLFTGQGTEPAAIHDEDLTLVEVERRHIIRVLEREQGHVGRAAERLGVPRSTLYQKIKKYGIET